MNLRVCGWKRIFFLAALHSCCAAYAPSKKNTGCAPTHRGSENGHAAAAWLRSWSQSPQSPPPACRASLTQQSQSGSFCASAFGALGQQGTGVRGTRAVAAMGRLRPGVFGGALRTVPAPPRAYLLMFKGREGGGVGGAKPRTRGPRPPMGERRNQRPGATHTRTPTPGRGAA
jgi:hypothetical protein